ncbi:RNA-binding protein [Acidisoma cladoniae]|uniref:RNA-binding protein n=1 Tax=Acidisoma cladoniae TaxID=3040935 RepID=UPI00254CFB10|nr:RNA-binding protein [Acidisoma sp. PAMC 29798]
MTLSPHQNEPASGVTNAALAPVIGSLGLVRPDELTPAAAESDDEEDPEKGPLRRCIVTRTSHPAEGMIRFVVGPDRKIVPDLTATLPGRGLWLSARRDVVETAVARKAFSRAARAEVLVPDDLPAMIEAALTRRVIDILGLTRRAGQAVSGFAKVREWLVADRVGLIVQAMDGSIDERARVLNGRDVPVITPFPGQTLGQIFGRENVVHVAVSAGRLATMLRVENERLTGIRRTRSDADQAGG